MYLIIPLTISSLYYFKIHLFIGYKQKLFNLYRGKRLCTMKWPMLNMCFEKGEPCLLGSPWILSEAKK